MRCTHCTTVIPHLAKYCPKCGREAGPHPSAQPPAAKDVHPSKTPMPRAGKMLIAFVLAAAALVTLGLTTHLPVLAIAGGIVLALLTAFLLVGDSIF